MSKNGVSKDRRHSVMLRLLCARAKRVMDGHPDTKGTQAQYLRDLHKIIALVERSLSEEQKEKAKREAEVIWIRNGH